MYINMYQQKMICVHVILYLNITMSAAIQYLQEVEWGIWNIETNNKLHFLKLIQWADKSNYL